jgi:hypothetical protein
MHLLDQNPGATGRSRRSLHDIRGEAIRAERAQVPLQKGWL